MELKTKLLTYNIISPFKGEISLSFALLSGDKAATVGKLDKLIKKLQSANKPLKINLDLWKDPRGNRANKYFHALVGKIAKHTDIQSSVDEVKRNLVFQYGTPATLPDNSPFWVKIPQGATLTEFKYAKYAGEETTGGRVWENYEIYKETHTLNSKEFWHLLQGTRYECGELGIDYRTEDEIASEEELIKAMEGK